MRDELGVLADAIDADVMLDQTQRWSAINTGTANLDGLARQAKVLANAFAELPGAVELVEPTPVTAVDAAGQKVDLPHGRHLVLRVRAGAERRLLLTGHMDTVYPTSHPFQEQHWREDGVLVGPGLADMKGGLCVILHALLAFERTDAAPAIGYDVLINSDEETGSLASAALIAELAQGKYAALTYEPSALPDGTLAHARGGSGNYALTFTGRSAHAGRNPQDGRNAVVAAADTAVQLKAMENGELSVNPAKIDGGSGNNVVPDHAVLRFNIRPKTSQAGEAFADALTDLLKQITRNHNLAVSCHGGVSRPPKPVDARAQKLFDLVRDCGRALGEEIGWQPSGGVCDGNNIAACGVPVVDTMGVRGGAIHSSEEYLITASLKERAMLSALVLQRLARGDAL
jgi:glutamate carboxypeptidase